MRLKSSIADIPLTNKNQTPSTELGDCVSYYVAHYLQKKLQILIIDQITTL